MAGAFSCRTIPGCDARHLDRKNMPKARLVGSEQPIQTQSTIQSQRPELRRCWPARRMPTLRRTPANTVQVRNGKGAGCDLGSAAIMAGHEGDTRIDRGSLEPRAAHDSRRPDNIQPLGHISINRHDHSTRLAIINAKHRHNITEHVSLNHQDNNLLDVSDVISNRMQT